MILIGLIGSSTDFITYFSHIAWKEQDKRFTTSKYVDMTKQRKRARNVTLTIISTGCDNAKSSTCDICDNAVSSGCHLQCNACDEVFHPLCANISNDVFHVLQPILSNISWVCPACISSIREKRKSVDDQLQCLSTSLHKLEVEHQSLVQKVDGLTTITPSSATNVQPIASISHAVLLNKAFCVFVRPILEFSSVVWNPLLRQDIARVESVQ